MVDSKSKVVSVQALFVGPGFATEVWVSDAVLDAIDHLQGGRDRRFPLKFRGYAKSGFRAFEGGPIRHEWDGVFRVAHGQTLFRVLGFFSKWPREFISIDAYQKHGQKLRKAEKDRIDKVAEVKKTGLWKKT